MKVARFYEPTDLRVEEADRPTPGQGELLIRVHACATCGTDVKIFHHGHRNLTVLPRVIGHEIAGEVVELGGGDVAWQPGDRVQCIAAVPCGHCYQCTHRSMTVCENLTSVGYQYDGGFAEYMVVPHQVLRVDGLNRIPDGLSYAEAAVTEPLACALNAQEQADVGRYDDETVVVVGSGPIGCLHVRLARARGARKVVLAEINSNRLKLAADRVEPDAAIDSSLQDPVQAVRGLTDGRGADVIIVAAGSGRAQEQAIDMAAPRGRISLFGGLPKDKPLITVDANTVHYTELTIVGPAGSTPTHNQQALEMIGSGAVPVADLITDRLPLERVLDAIAAVESGTSIKVVIEP
jgi:L-iditol 2-dehydrogenase